MGNVATVSLADAPSDTEPRYTILRKLATGGMAQLYLARQRGLAGFERLVVLKTLLPGSVKEEDRQMLLNEARIGARVLHPNVVQIFDITVVDEQPCIVMEFLAGPNLSGLVTKAKQRGQRLSVSLICGIMTDVLDGLEAIHAAADGSGRSVGLVHRDISPQNIIITDSGVTKLVDFGIAKETSSSVRQLTQAGQFKGKFAYMSPEQVQFGRLDARSDLFSAGIVFWELLAWRRLFRRASELETMRAVLEAPIPELKPLNAHVSDDLMRIVGRALCRDASGRYQSAAAMRSDLERVLFSKQWRCSSRQRQTAVQELFADDPALAPDLLPPEAAPARWLADRTRIDFDAFDERTAVRVASAATSSAIEVDVAHFLAAAPPTRPTIAPATDDSDELAPEVVVESAPGEESRTRIHRPAAARRRRQRRALPLPWLALGALLLVLLALLLLR